MLLEAAPLDRGSARGQVHSLPVGWPTSINRTPSLLRRRWSLVPGVPTSRNYGEAAGTQHSLLGSRLIFYVGGTFFRLGRTLVHHILSGVARSLGRLLGRMPGVLSRILGSMPGGRAGLFGRVTDVLTGVLSVVARVFHILFRAVIRGRAVLGDEAADTECNGEQKNRW